MKVEWEMWERPPSQAPSRVTRAARTDLGSGDRVAALDRVLTAAAKAYGVSPRRRPFLRWRGTGWGDDQRWQEHP